MEPCTSVSERFDKSRENIPDDVTVCQLRSGSMLKVPVKLDNLNLSAVVDTAAEVTLISDSIYRQLDPKPQILKHIKLHTAGKNLDMIGFVVGPVSLRLGSQTFQEAVYVAPIEDDMLLGINFLVKHDANLDLKNSILSLGSDQIPMESKSDKKQPTLAKVSVFKRRVIPLNSMTHVECCLAEPLDQYIIEPVANERIIVPKTVHRSEQMYPQVCVLNLSDRFVTLKKGREVGQASVVHTVTPIPNEFLGSVASVSQNVESKEAQIPEHLKDMYDKSIKNLDQDESSQFAKLLLQFQDVFAKTDFDLGNFTEIEHKIDTGDAKPIKQHMRRTPVMFAQEEEAHLKKLLDAEVIRPSCSDWASNPVLIRKRDGSVRWCLDFRSLNNVTVKDVFPLPIIEECLDTLAGNVWFSKLDANSAYWQIPIADGDIKKTAFVTKFGLYEFVKMPFGLCNAPATFSRAISLVLRGLTWNIVLAFLDDILVLGKNFKDHLQNLSQVLERLRKYKLKLKPRKCEFFQTKVEFLDRTVSGDGLDMGDSAIQTVVDWPTPASAKDVERFLGYANYHRGFIQDFSKTSVPLYQVTGKKEFVWGEEQETSFRALKKAFTSAPMLSLPDREGMFVLDTDASDFAIGAELSQIQDGKERVITFCSYALSSEQRRYCTTRKELLAIVRFTRQFRHYLLGRFFIIRTDHSSLVWLLNFKNPQGQLARWIEELGQYYMVVKHRPGAKHGNGDPLSRLPEPCKCENYKFGFDLKMLPCKGCTYCQRAHNNWSQFAQDVDYVLPLAGRAEVRVSNVHTDGLVSGFEIDISQSDSLIKGDSDCPLDDQVYLMAEGSGGAGKGVSVQAVTRATGSQMLTFWGHDKDDLVQKQTDEPALQILLNWLKDKNEPSPATLKRASPEEKYFWINKELFLLEDGVLWKKNLEDEDRVLVVPRALRGEILRLNHDLPSAGHQGMDRTKHRIMYKYFWYGMSSEIKRFVSSCSVCNQCKKPSRKNRSPLILNQTGAPMERVHIDFIGPLPRTERGNEHVLMVVDQFTKWVECFPLPSQSAEVTAGALVNDFFSRFGCPFEIFSDQGRNFESLLFAKLCEILRIHKTRTTPYRPSGNG